MKKTAFAAQRSSYFAEQRKISCVLLHPQLRKVAIFTWGHLEMKKSIWRSKKKKESNDLRKPSQTKMKKESKCRYADYRFYVNKRKREAMRVGQKKKRKRYLSRLLVELSPTEPRVYTCFRYYFNEGEGEKKSYRTSLDNLKGEDQ